MYEVVSNINGEKAPGPGGFKMALSQSCWGILKEDVMTKCLFRRLCHGLGNCEAFQLHVICRALS